MVFCQITSLMMKSLAIKYKLIFIIEFVKINSSLYLWINTFETMPGWVEVSFSVELKKIGFLSFNLMN